MKRNAFTLLEIVMVIAIITILVGMLFVGGKSLFGNAQARETGTRLGTARAMLSDFLDATKSQSGKRAQPDSWEFNNTLGAQVNVSQTQVGDFTLSFWQVPLVVDVNGNGSRDGGDTVIPLIAPAGSYSVAGEGFQHSNTRAALVMMSRLPSVAKTLNDLPSASRQNMSDIGSINPPALRIPLLVDSWGNPLLFVPGTGLMGVSSGGQPANTIDNPIKSDGQPFWASAGADGNFRTGDDNQYSFDN